MPSFVISSLVETPQTLSESQSGTITLNGSLVTDGNAITASGASGVCTIRNSGEVISINGFALAHTGYYAIVTNSGRMFSNNGLSFNGNFGFLLQNSGLISSSGSGISSNITAISGGFADIDNAGTVQAYSSAISIDLGDNTARIVNTGTLTSISGAGVRFYGFGTGLVQITNGGTIQGNATAISIDSNPSNVTNAGRIVGNVILGGAADVYLGTNGTVQGSIFGQGGNDSLTGGASVDMLFGGGDNDTLTGTGGDHLWGGTGADVHIGGDGLQPDYARYDDASHGNLTIRLDYEQLNTGAAAGDTYENIEGLVGGMGNDNIYGDDAANFLFGGAGNDQVFGNAGNDFLSGDAGSDNLWGGAGADQHRGGAGTDYARYDDAAHGNLVISLLSPSTNTGVAAGDTYSGIEGLVGGTGNDVVIGDFVANTLFGQAGSDFIDGREGNDLLFGGTGADSFRFATGLGASNVDTINDFAAGVDDMLLTQAIFSMIGPSLTADEFRIGAAFDGNDYILYNSATGALTYDTNGNGAGGATQFATIGAGLALTIADFVMV